ncbi:MAG: CsbD family protein [Spirochaetaceae bacterium]|nr:MAG: CsbD family protein [Spirochaetaceae bacterium]
MNKDQVKGRVDQAKGKVKEEVGKATDDKNMQRKGQARKVHGKLQAGYGDVKEKIKR